MRRLSEGAAELAAEVGAGKAGRAGEVVDVERLEVAGIGQISGPKQVADGRNDDHATLDLLST